MRRPAGRIHEIRELASANGIRWTLQHLLLKANRRVLRSLEARQHDLETSRDLPGINTRDRNRRVWDGWDWSQSGEEWTPSPEWKAALVKHVMAPYLEGRRRIVEIGPGGGRWTEHLQKIADELTLVDLSSTCIEQCKQRFANCSNITYYVNSGADLSMVPAASVDAIWSFDAFVHIAPPEIRAYVDEFARVLVPGGIGVIHHGDGGSTTGWRSAMDAKRFRELLEGVGLEVTRQFDSWGDQDEFDVKTLGNNPRGDKITAFRRPA
ncbi:MAG: class I SAM-dependent methyltransferase [Actinomycetota bacterium]